MTASRRRTTRDRHISRDGESDRSPILRGRRRAIWQRPGHVTLAGDAPPDLWIVAAADDGVAAAVAERAVARGLDSRWVSFREFSQTATIRFSGSETSIEPCAPVLLRSSWSFGDRDPDGSFLALEAYAQVWSACALSTASVINRPSAHGFTGSADHLSQLSLLRARASGVEVDLAPEVYSSEWSEEDGNWAVQDLVTYRTASVPERPSGDGPYRYRSWHPTREYKTVTVVDHQGWANRRADHALIERSVTIVSALGLRFGAVTWGLFDLGADPARIDAYPSRWAIGPNLDLVCAALLQALLT